MQAKYRLMMALILGIAGISLVAAAILMTPMVAVPGVGFPLFSLYLLVLGGAAMSFTFAFFGGVKAIGDLINNCNEGSFLPQTPAEEQSLEKPQTNYVSLEQRSSENQSTDLPDEPMSEPYQKPQGCLRSLCCFFGSTRQDKNTTQIEATNDTSSTHGVHN